VAQNQGVNGQDHRYFLNQFYTGRCEGSFATGVAFAESPSKSDCRVCGPLASVAVLKQAIEVNANQLVKHGIGRILLAHSIILNIGGIALLYLGDEIGLTSDHNYRQDSSKEHDARCVHRIA
jgi:amylosucrase